MLIDEESSRFVTDSVSIAVAVGFWTILSWFAWDPGVASGFRYIGLAVGLFYAVVQGYTHPLSRPHPATRTDVLRENWRLLLITGPWFLGTIAIKLITGVWNWFGLPGLFVPSADSFVFIFVATAVITAVQYAVAGSLGRIDLRSE